jgi:hypothetical protein
MMKLKLDFKKIFAIIIILLFLGIIIAIGFGFISNINILNKTP